MLPVRQMMTSALRRAQNSGTSTVRMLHSSVPTPTRAGSHMTEHSSEAMANAKERQLKGECAPFIPNTEGWSQNLASVSEATVKADQAPDMPIEEMQKFSVNVISQADRCYPDKLGMDVSDQPDIKENLRRTREDPTAAGHSQ